MSKNNSASAFPVIGMDQRGEQTFIGVFERGISTRLWIATHIFAQNMITFEAAFDLAEKMIAEEQRRSEAEK